MVFDLKIALLCGLMGGVYSAVSFLRQQNLRKPLSMMLTITTWQKSIKVSKIQLMVMK
jgi:hypothetical protein